VGRDSLAVIFDMRFGCFRRVVHCVFVVTTGQVCVVSCGFVFTRFMVLCGFFVVSCRVFMVFCCLVVMLHCVL
jgi:hypothetical protein